MCRFWNASAEAEGDKQIFETLRNKSILVSSNLIPKQNTTQMNTNDFGMDDSFASFVQELEQAEQPKACTIDNPDCEACGS